MEKQIKTWSPQQQAFFDWCEKGTGSVVVEAVAGAGKTSVLMEAGQRIRGGVMYVVYAKKNALEAQDKLKKAGIDWKKMQASTVHSAGFKALAKTFGNIKLDDKKTYGIVDQLVPEGHKLFAYRSVIVKLVGLAKQRAIGVMGAIDNVTLWMDIVEHFDVIQTEGDDEEAPVEEIIALAQQVLRVNNMQTSVVDYNDMVYLPLVHKCKFWQYDVVMVDEAQDTNPARRALVRAMLRKGGRCIAVGDRHQAIFGFTGADSDSLDLISQDFNCGELPLTVSFRCPKKVVSFAQKWVNHIQSAPEAPEGMVFQCFMDQFVKRNDLNGSAAVLCRNTKPLVELAFKLIRAKIACKVEGSDIGEGIKKLINRWKVRTLDQLLVKLDVYLARETTKLLAKKQEDRLARIEDQVETVKVIIDQCIADKKTLVTDATKFVDDMFDDRVTEKGILCLSTIHKSKGLEWERVFWLDRAGTCPSKWARQAWQQEQEVNLQYVAATRAKSELIDLSPDNAPAA